jgi:hypothetical protein
MDPQPVQGRRANAVVEPGWPAARRPGSVSRAMGSLIKKRRKRMRKKKHKKMLRRTRHQRQRGK